MLSSDLCTIKFAARAWDLSSERARQIADAHGVCVRDTAGRRLIRRDDVERIAELRAATQR